MLHVTILGARGIPACYSGYDTLVDELARGLVKTGKVSATVYCRTSYYKNRLPVYEGVKLIYLPAPRIKAFESLFHSFLSMLHVLTQKPDVVYFVDPANAPFCLFLKIMGKKVVIHTNGLGWKRRKWGHKARKYYKFVEWLSAKTLDVLITDNPEMKTYYQNEYAADSEYIPFGATNYAGLDETAYEKYKLTKNGYYLVVARLEKENNTDLIIKEYVKSETDLPLVIVGDAPYDPQYWNKLHRLANDNVIFLGRINNQAHLNSLYNGAYLYIHGHEVGGTNPSLLRAMNYSAAPLVINSPFNISVVGKGGIVFKKREGHLSDILKRLSGSPEIVKELGDISHTITRKKFTWKSVVTDHLNLFLSIASMKQPLHFR